MQNRRADLRDQQPDNFRRTRRNLSSTDLNRVVIYYYYYELSLHLQVNYAYYLLSSFRHTFHQIHLT